MVYPENLVVFNSFSTFYFPFQKLTKVLATPSASTMLEEVLVLSLSRQTLEANAKQTNKNYKMITANQIKQVKKPEKEKKKQIPL